jgi:hypothetical protein
MNTPQANEVSGLNEPLSDKPAVQPVEVEAEDELLISGLEMLAGIAADEASKEANHSKGYYLPGDTVAGKAAARLKALLASHKESRNG